MQSASKRTMSPSFARLGSPDQPWGPTITMPPKCLLIQDCWPRKKNPLDHVSYSKGAIWNICEATQLYMCPCENKAQLKTPTPPGSWPTDSVAQTPHNLKELEKQAFTSKRSWRWCTNRLPTPSKTALNQLIKRWEMVMDNAALLV